MGVNLKLLAKHGISSRSYKRIFARDPAKYPKPIQRLKDLISSRIKDGRMANLDPDQWRGYLAVDKAFDVPYSQTTATFVQDLMSRNLNEEEMLQALEAYGLSEKTLYTTIQAPNGAPVRVLNPPVLFQVVIPLVKAYLSVREATLFNARNRQPFLPYKPLKMTQEDQVLAEVWTDIVGTQARWYGYPAVLRQCIHQMLKYGVMMTFPQEEWHVEEQMQYTGAVDKEGNPVEECVVEKEGLRYHIPHPTRMFWDLRRPVTSINTDTGIEFMGHWWVENYGNVLDNQLYWNRQKIFCGTNWFDFPNSRAFWQELMPCNMKHPWSGRGTWNNPTREDKAAWYSQSGGRDLSIFLTSYYQKLRPKEFGLGLYDDEDKLVKSYDYPVWHRFIVAGDDTIVFAEPCAYNPSWFMGYDHDENAGRNSSMALELIPWQDQLGNILSQMILTAKQNLRDVIFYDTNIIEKDDIKQIRNEGENAYRKTIWLGFDSLQRRVSQVSQQQAFQQVPFTQKPINEMLQMVPTLLNLLERVMQISASEAGAQGTHQQSKFELEQIGGGTSNRVQFIGASVDEGVDAWKRQLHDADCAYLDPEFEAQVSSDIENLKEVLNKLGFTVGQKGDEKWVVQGKVESIRLEGFASATEGSLAPDKDQAQVIFQVVGTVAGQPELFKRIGAANLLAIIEFAAKLAGASQDFRLRILPKDQQEGDEEVPENIMEAIKAAQQATLQMVSEQIAKPAAQEHVQVEQQIQQLQQMVQKFQNIFQIAEQITQRDQIKAQETQAKIANRQAEVQASIELKRQESAAEQQRLNAETEAKVHRENVLTAADVHRQHAETEAAVAVKAGESQANIEIKKDAAEQSAKIAEKAAAKAGTGEKKP